MLVVTKKCLILQRQNKTPKWSLRLVWSGRQVFILVTRVQIPERLPPIPKTLTNNQAVRVFSYPKHPPPCQPRVNRFRNTCFLVAQNSSHKVPSLTRLTLSVDAPKKTNLYHPPSHKHSPTPSPYGIIPPPFPHETHLRKMRKVRKTRKIHQ